MRESPARGYNKEFMDGKAQIIAGILRSRSVVEACACSLSVFVAMWLLVSAQPAQY